MNPSRSMDSRSVEGVGTITLTHPLIYAQNFVVPRKIPEITRSLLRTNPRFTYLIKSAASSSIIRLLNTPATLLSYNDFDSIDARLFTKTEEWEKSGFHRNLVDRSKLSY